MTDTVDELTPVETQIYEALPVGDIDVIDELKESLPDDEFVEAFTNAYNMYQSDNETPEEERIAYTIANVAEENEQLMDDEEV